MWQVIGKTVLGGLLTFGAKVAGTEVIRRVSVSQGAKLIRTMVRGYFIPAIVWFKDWLLGVVDPYTPEEIDVMLRNKADQTVKAVDEVWTNEEKIRFVLDMVSRKGLKGTFELLQGKGWEFIKANAPAEILELVNSLRTSQAADDARDKVEKETGIRPSIHASVAAVEEAHKAIRGKELAVRAREVFAEIRGENGKAD